MKRDCQIFDAEGLLEYFEHDLPFIAQLLELFLPEAERRVQQVKQAAASGDLEALYLSAHSLKSQADTAKTNALGLLAAALAEAAQSGDEAAAAEASTGIESEFHRARRAICEWQASLAPRR